MCSYILTEKFTLTTLSKFYRIESSVEKKRDIERKREEGSEGERQEGSRQKEKGVCEYKESKFERKG